MSQISRIGPPEPYQVVFQAWWDEESSLEVTIVLYEFDDPTDETHMQLVELGFCDLPAGRGSHRKRLPLLTADLVGEIEEILPGSANRLGSYCGLRFRISVDGAFTPGPF